MMYSLTTINLLGEAWFWNIKRTFMPVTSWSVMFIMISSVNRPTPANTTHWNNVGLMLGHRLRRWPNIKPTLFQCVVFAGTWYMDKYHCVITTNIPFNTRCNSHGDYRVICCLYRVQRPGWVGGDLWAMYVCLIIQERLPCRTSW